MLHLHYGTLSDFIQDCNPINLEDAVVPNLSNQVLCLSFGNPHPEFLYKDSLDGFDRGFQYIWYDLMPRLENSHNELAHSGRIYEPVLVDDYRINLEYCDGILMLEGDYSSEVDLQRWASFVQPAWTLLQIYISELLGARSFVQKWNLPLPINPSLGDLSLAPYLFGRGTGLFLGSLVEDDWVDSSCEEGTLGQGFSELLWSIELYTVDNPDCLSGTDLWEENGFGCPFPEDSHLFKWFHQCLLTLPGKTD